MRGHLLVRGVQVRLVAAWFRHSGFGVVRDDQLWAASQEFEGAHMGPDPGDHLLVFAGFRVGVLRHSVCVWIPLVCVGISRPRAEIDGGGKAGGIIRGAGDRILARGGRNSVDSTFAVRGPHHG